MAEGKHRSLIWNYFTIASPEDSKAKCNICESLISRGGSSAKRYTTTNLRNHLKIKHPNAMKEMENAEKDALQKKRKSDNGTGSSSSEAKKVYQQTKLTDVVEKVTPWSPTDTRTQNQNKLLAEMIALDLQPFSITSDVGFIRYTKGLEQRYSLPSDQHLSRTLIPEIYQKIVIKLRSDLENIKHISVTTDIWSSSTGSNSLMSLTGHYIDEEFRHKKCILNASSFEGSHTGDAIASELTRMLEEWSLKDSVVSVVRDNAANAISGCEKTGLDHFGCFIHTLQLVIKDGLSAQRSVNDALAISRKIATHFNHSPLAYHRLRAIQSKHQLKQHHIIQDVQTRWNSTFLMLERLLEQKLAIVEYTTEYDVATLNSNQWNLIQALVTTLRRFNELTKEASMSDASCALIIPSVRLLDRVLSQHRDDKGIQTITSTMHESLKRRFNDMEEQKRFVLSTFLDPRYKSVFFERVTKDNIELWLKEDKPDVEISSQPSTEASIRASTSAESEHKSKSFLIDKDYEEMMLEKGAHASCSTQNLTLIDELNVYMSESVISRRDNPSVWWRDHKSRFPKLADRARKYLCIPPSSIPSERLFSEAGDLYDDKRNRLKPEKAEMVLVIRGNLPLLNFQY